MHHRAYDKACVIRASDTFLDHMFCETHGRLFNPFASLVNTCVGPKTGATP